MNSIGVRIRKIRKNNNLTQVEFSKAVCISQPHLSKVERGEDKPSKPVIKLISLLFGADESWLING